MAEENTERKKLIVGIDPGTTAGYAVLDINGKLLQTGASKEFALDAMMSKIVALGNVLVVGCDKAKVPDFVAKFATKTGAKVICPDEDLLVDEKRKLTEQMQYDNVHEMDALASALFAWKNVEQLFNRIDTFLQKENKTEMSAEVKKIVLKNNLSIKSALKFIEKENNEISKITILTEPKLQINKNSKINEHKEQLIRLKQEKKDLTAELLKTKKLVAGQQKHIQKLENKESVDVRITQKEQRIISLNNTITQKETKIQELRQQNMHLFQLLSKSKEHIIMPRMKNLGWQEYTHRTQKFPLNPNDLVFVDDPYSFSQQTIEELRKKNITVLSQREAKNNTLTAIGIAVMNVRDVVVELQPTIAVVKKTDIDRKRKEKFWIQDVVQEYQQERKNNLDKP